MKVFVKFNCEECGGNNEVAIEGHSITFDFRGFNGEQTAKTTEYVYVGCEYCGREHEVDLHGSIGVINGIKEDMYENYDCD